MRINSLSRHFRNRGTAVWFVVVVLVFIGGLLLGRYIKLGHYVKSKLSARTAEVTYDNPPLRAKDSGYNFISPLYACGSLGKEEFREFIPLKTEIQKIVDDTLYTKTATALSVYFRDLNRGRRVAINDTEKYFPASLSKVPLMMTYFKLAESKPNLLSEEILYDGSFDANIKEDIKPKKLIESGKRYTVDELIQAMILYSDNNATRLLFDHLEPALLSEVFSDLNVPVPKDNDLDTITVKSYSYFFRVLYNATYLSREMSEKALALLSQASFQNGIRAGVPQDVPVAEKYGESTIYLSQSTIHSRELHDCGIVYDAKNPYLLCVMTKGDNFENLIRVIQDISKVAHQEIVSPSYQN